MVSVKCETETCPLCDEVFNVLGDPEIVQCGGCGVFLTPYDQRPDPVVEEVTLNAVTD